MTESSTNWNKTEILCLIKLVGKPFASNHGVYLNEIFMEAATKLFEHGFQKTYCQCRNKWMALVNEYKEFRKDEMTPEPLFYVELDRILSKLPQFCKNYRPWTEPETISLLNIIKEGHYLLELQRDTDDMVFEKLAKELENSGYKLRQKNEVKLRWQKLKAVYRSYLKGEVLNFKYFDSIDKILNWDSNNIEIDDSDENVTYDSEDCEVKLKEIRKKSSNWSHKETLILLRVIKGSKYPDITRTEKNDMFDKASMQLRSEGFKRSNEQCRLKFKHLKAKYFRALKKQKELSINPEHFCSHFYKLHEIMCKRNEVEEIFEEDYEIEYLEDYSNEDNFTDCTESKTTERNLWTPQEISSLIHILKMKNIKYFNRKSFFEEVSSDLTKLGYNKSPNTCMIKWKNLRRQYKISIEHNINCNSEICGYFEEIHEIVKQFKTNEKLEYVENNDTIENDDSETLKDVHDSSLTMKRESGGNEFPQPKRFKNSETNENRLVCNYKMDDIQHYCMSLADTFRRLPNIKQAKLKIEFQKLLFKAEFDDNF